MLRLTGHFTLTVLVLLTAAKLLAQQATSSSVLAREGVSTTFWGGCADTRLDGVWVAVRAEPAKAPGTASLEMWLVDAASNGGASLRRMHVVPARPFAARAASLWTRRDWLGSARLRNCTYTACRATGWPFSPSPTTAQETS